MNFLIKEDLFSKHLNPSIKVKNNKLPLLQSIYNTFWATKLGLAGIVEL